MNDKILLFFTSNYCSPCSLLKNIVEDSEKTASLVIKYINVDNDKDLPKKYEVSKVPTLIIIDENDSEVDRKEGLINKEEYEKFISQ